MTAGDDRPPQSAAEAIEMGWIWIGLECRRCLHKGYKRLDDFTVAQSRKPLAQVIKRMCCSNCGARSFSAEIGIELPGLAGRNWAHRKAIEFQGERTIRPPRS